MSIQFRPIPLDIFDQKQRPAIARLNSMLHDLCALEGTIKQPRAVKRSDNSISRIGEQQVHVTRITPDIMDVVSGASSIVATPALTFGLTNTVGSTTGVLSVNSAVALFSTATPPPVDADAAIAGLSATAANLGHKHQVSTAVPAFTFGTSATIGTAATLVRSDAALAIFDATPPAALAGTSAHGSVNFAADAAHVHLFPTALRSTANASTLTLTDDGTNQTATGSLGSITITPIATGVVLGSNSKSSALARIGIGASPNSIQAVNVDMNASVTNSAALSFDIRANVATGIIVNGVFGLCDVSNASGTGNNAILRSFFSESTVRGTSKTVSITGMQMNVEEQGTDATTIVSTRYGTLVGANPAGPTFTNTYGHYVNNLANGTNRWAFYAVTDSSYFGGSVSILNTLNHDGAYVGLYGATPTVQFGTTGTASGFAVGTSTAVTVDSTYTGNTGTLAYTIGDAIRALKLLGALAY